MRGGRGESRPIRHALLHFGVLQSGSASDKARGGWLIVIGAAASKTKPTASANFNECNQKNRFGRLSGPNGDRPVAVDPDKGMGGNNKRANEHARPETNYPASTTPVHVRSSHRARAQWSTPRSHCGPGSDKITLLICRCVKAALLKLWRVRLPNVQPFKKATAPATACAAFFNLRLMYH